MNLRHIAIDVLVGSVLLFVLVRLVGPLFGGASIGVLRARDSTSDRSEYGDVVPGAIAGVALGFLYLITVSGIGTSILYHSIDAEPFIEHSVRTIQLQFKLLFQSVTGTERISIVYFSLVVGLYAFGTTVLGERLGRGVDPDR